MAAKVSSSDAPGVVVVYTHKEDGRRRMHEASTHSALAARIARLKGWEYAGEFDPSSSYRLPLYFVPSDTLVPVDFARRLGIQDEHHLFGGVVPHPFIATKTITHSLLDDHADAPQGWSREFSRYTKDVVLPGYSAFSIRDAMRAGTRLLEQGAVRLKRADGIGGLGQSVARNFAQLDEQLAAIGQAELEHAGLVLELNLANIKTYSVGQVRIDGQTATYCGTQDLTYNNNGQEVYGGSQLIIARGDFDALLQLALPQEMQVAVSQARTYHAAALASYHGMFASRCNYDVARGEDEHGRIHAGVLEQSWRIGGASGAEIAALEAFHANPSLKEICASTTEVYGEPPELPAGAQVYFQGEDPDVGPLTKFSRTNPYANP
ncbi:DUF3182 family protein [Oxalobacteraceae bacterium R-40]|uniref:DUF3182 family protein n=1 Tax=Keguizhuia sedimenti TaxID=3064264 RepID=A0ABU1BSC6_9BURK|nr:DUF3182 family protein [Oxalobacteraceae bacterium R-40]